MPPASEDLDLRSRWVGALPLVNAVIGRLDLIGLLARHVPAHHRQAVEPALLLGVLLRNFTLSKDALYAQADWAWRCEPHLLGVSADQLQRCDDDRVGRALDRLYQADRASLLTEVAVRTVRVFSVALDELHNDSTTVTFSGDYRRATGRTLHGRRALRITHGFNKDHRPDLKQLVWVLTVSADGAVPVHFRLCDGNTGDAQTHLETWRAVSAIAGRADFLYVADSKLCTRDAMTAIDTAGGRFLTVLPKTRAEEAELRRWVRQDRPAWQDLGTRPNPRDPEGAHDLWRAVESPRPSAEGYRIILYWSSLKAERDARSRTEALDKAEAALRQVADRLAGPRCRLHEREPVEDAIATALGERARDWIRVRLTQRDQETFRQERPGRPTAETRYRRIVTHRWLLEWHLDLEALHHDAACDGIFPLITNDRHLTPEQLLATYKYQPCLEKRHQQLKTVQHVAPVFLKNEGRVEAMLLVHYLALLVHALLERSLRLALKDANLTALPIYPEQRDCPAPTADRLLATFDQLQCHRLYAGDHLVRSFPPQLSPLQRQIIDLMHISPDDFAPA